MAVLYSVLTLCVSLSLKVMAPLQAADREVIDASQWSQTSGETIGVYQRGERSAVQEHLGTTVSLGKAPNNV